jgi:hypothetical protein
LNADRNDRGRLPTAHFLIITQPKVDHVNPVLPISRTLVRRGSEVAWITGKSFKKKVGDSIPYPDKFDPDDRPCYEFWPEMGKHRGSHPSTSGTTDASLPLKQIILDLIRHHPVGAGGTGDDIFRRFCVL